MQSLAEEKPVMSSAYGMFSYSIRNELTRKYYERRLKIFFDYIGLELQSDLESRCNLFAKRRIITAFYQTIYSCSFKNGGYRRRQNGIISTINAANFFWTVEHKCRRFTLLL